LNGTGSGAVVWRSLILRPLHRRVRYLQCGDQREGTDDSTSEDLEATLDFADTDGTEAFGCWLLAFEPTFANETTRFLGPSGGSTAFCIQYVNFRAPNGEGS
jgi:hypothetical protein